MPFFSVIIPVFNREQFIAKAIHSVLNQTFQDFEIIIVDDASTDTTPAIIKEFSDSRISYIRNDTNKERCVSRNIGMAKAQGQYICFLDSDDYHLPEHLQVLYDSIVRRKYPIALLFTNAWDEQNNTRHERMCPHLEQYNVFEYIALYTFNPQRMCVHRSIVQVIQFDPAVYVCEDLDFAARIALEYPIIQIPQRTTVYVHHAGSFTGGDSKKAFKELENYTRIFAKPQLRNRIPVRAKRLLRSMCYFHIARYHEVHNNICKMYQAISKSFLLYPKGYNGKTNKILLVMFVYHLPLFGGLVRRSMRK